MTRIALIGSGAIAHAIVCLLREHPSFSHLELAGVLARSRCRITQEPFLRHVPLVTDLDALLALRPDMVVEVASQAAVWEFGPSILEAGHDFLIASVGCLASEELLCELNTQAVRGGARILLPAGAIGGLDILAAYRLGGIERILYRSVKPVVAWRGTPAEGLVDLAGITSRVVFFRGNARNAALMFPQNANVAATIALAGAGFDQTDVELIADPSATANRHELSSKGPIGEFSIVIENNALPGNPKTSALTVFSIAQAICQRNAAIVLQC